jgi:plasmid stability protein
MNMNTLHVRNVPSEVYEALRERAAERDSSISAETVRLLKRALRTDRLGLRQLFDSIEAVRPSVKRAPSVAELIREDRDTR